MVDPTPEEWLLELSGAGGEGGCRAELLQYVDEDNIYEEKGSKQLPDGSSTDIGATTFTREGLLDRFKTMKNFQVGAGRTGTEGSMAAPSTNRHGGI
jgi:hypothetical protein